LLPFNKEPTGNATLKIEAEIDKNNIKFIGRGLQTALLILHL
jgi:hypothetical protein